MEPDHQSSQPTQEKCMWCLEDHRWYPQKIRLWNVGEGAQADQSHQLHGKFKELLVHSQDQTLGNSAAIFRVRCSRFHWRKDHLTQFEVAWSLQTSEDDQADQRRAHACATRTSTRLLKISSRKVSHSGDAFSSLRNPPSCIRKRQTHHWPDQQAHKFSSEYRPKKNQIPKKRRILKQQDAVHNHAPESPAQGHCPGSKRDLWEGQVYKMEGAIIIKRHEGNPEQPEPQTQALQAA